MKDISAAEAMQVLSLHLIQESTWRMHALSLLKLVGSGIDRDKLAKECQEHVDRASGL